MNNQHAKPGPKKRGKSKIIIILLLIIVIATTVSLFAYNRMRIKQIEQEEIRDMLLFEDTEDADGSADDTIEEEVAIDENAVPIPPEEKIMWI